MILKRKTIERADIVNIRKTFYSVINDALKNAVLIMLIKRDCMKMFRMLHDKIVKYNR